MIGMLALDKKILLFKIKEIHFSEKPFNVEGCDFLIFPFCKNKVDVKGFVRYQRFTSIIDLTQDLDTIFNKFHRDTYKGIKRAEREGITISVNTGYERFFELYQDFVRKKEIDSVFGGLGVETASLDTMKKKGTLFTAEHCGEMLGGMLFLEDEENIETLVSASKRLDRDAENKAIIGSVNRLIRWEAMKYAKEKGIKEFDLGGIFPEEKVAKDPEKKGINSFKLSFGGDVVPGYAYEKGYSKILNFAYRLYNYKIGRKPL
jgi:lipid II:glycine glycyltransferase (peptidoglycan interpeptide bridge formation enzyme)